VAGAKGTLVIRNSAPSHPAPFVILNVFRDNTPRLQPRHPETSSG
jgi:hypothetical protein